MAKFIDDKGIHEIETDRAWAKLAGGRNATGIARLDFGRAAVHLTRDTEFSTASDAKAITWKGETDYHALFATVGGASEEQAADLAKRYSSTVVRGFFDIPRSGAKQHTGPCVQLLAPPTAPPAASAPPPPPPTVTIASLLKDKRALEARLQPVRADREAREQRLHNARAALKEARGAFVTNESETAAQAIEAAEREVRLATLMEQAKPDATALERELAAVNAEIDSVLGSSPAFAAPYFNGAQFTQTTTFEHIARSFYEGGTSWLSRGPKEQGHAMFSFDLGAATRLELHQRLRFRCVAHSLAEAGWRVTAPLSRPVTRAELLVIANHLGARSCHVHGSTPPAGSCRIVDIDECAPFEVPVDVERALTPSMPSKETTQTAANGAA